MGSLTAVNVVLAPFQNRLLSNAVAFSHHPSRVLGGLDFGSGLRCCSGLDMRSNEHDVFRPRYPLKLTLPRKGLATRGNFIVQDGTTGIEKDVLNVAVVH
jgi:hypothetical protein